MKNENQSFDIGLTVSSVALVAIIVFIILFAFIPRPSIAPSRSPLEGGREAATSTEIEIQRFVGILPCDSCDGIRTELVLRNDGTFRLTETYLGKIASRPVIEVGKWTTLRGNARDLKAIIYRINFDKLNTAKNFLLLSDGNIKIVNELQEEFLGEGNYLLEPQK
jgi:hypothetical protein